MPVSLVSHEPGEVLAEGKTKFVIQGFGEHDVTIESKDDITAGDGARHDVIEGKGALANTTTCNVFRLLKSQGVPVAFHRQTGPNTFSAPRCMMLPYEVVVRREAHGSYLKRHPDLEKGHVFEELVREFFLKTSGCKWNDRDLPCEDPLMGFGIVDEVIHLYDPQEPSLPNNPAKPFLTLREDEVFSWNDEHDLLKQMGVMAGKAFSILEGAWKEQGGRLVDFKVEFGLTPDGRLLLADVIDADSCRVLNEEGENLDKQIYRDGGTPEEVFEKYRLFAELTSRF